MLDLTEEAAFLAGKILGDLGADVVKIEAPGGDGPGRRGPYLGEVEIARAACCGWRSTPASVASP